MTINPNLTRTEFAQQLNNYLLHYNLDAAQRRDIISFVWDSIQVLPPPQDDPPGTIRKKSGYFGSPATATTGGLTKPVYFVKVAVPALTPHIGWAKISPEQGEQVWYSDDYVANFPIVKTAFE